MLGEMGGDSVPKPEVAPSLAQRLPRTRGSILMTLGDAFMQQQEAVGFHHGRDLPEVSVLVLREVVRDERVQDRIEGPGGERLGEALGAKMVESDALV